MKTAPRIIIATLLASSLAANVWQWSKLQRWEAWADQSEEAKAKLLAEAKAMEARLEAHFADAEKHSAEMMQLAQRSSHLRQVGNAQTELLIAQYEAKISRLELENERLRSR